MIDYTALITALKEEYARAGSLRKLRGATKTKLLREPFSIADWGRILRDDTVMDFRHGMQVATLIGETIDIPPILFEAMSENRGTPEPEYAVHRCTGTLDAISGAEGILHPKRAPGRKGRGGNIVAIARAARLAAAEMAVWYGEANGNGYDAVLVGWAGGRSAEAMGLCRIAHASRPGTLSAAG